MIVTNLYKTKEQEPFYTFEIDGVSRALLQELARHRYKVGITVKSTRYTLKELKGTDITDDVVLKYCVIPPMLDANERMRFIDDAKTSLCMVANWLNDGYSNDKIKSLIPECYKTSLVWTIGESSLRNFLKLRTDKSAYWEIRRLAYAIFSSLDIESAEKLSDCIYKGDVYD